MFTTELEMSKRFEKFTKQYFGNAYLKECQGLFGIPDFVFYDKKQNETSIISFELKLKNWKRAMKQAFRHKSFSNISYVVLPAKHVSAALKNISLFEQYNIGLATFAPDNTFEIIFKPELSQPYSDNLNSKIATQVKSSRKKLKNIDFLYC
ncbi:MAG: hypothetical protein GY834_02870 [Bacteroidetes bacterium]|nr:hypothetical protein [Bacteroidota bacterium]